MYFFSKDYSIFIAMTDTPSDYASPTRKIELITYDARKSIVFGSIDVVFGLLIITVNILGSADLF